MSIVFEEGRIFIFIITNTNLKNNGFLLTRGALYPNAIGVLLHPLKII